MYKEYLGFLAMLGYAVLAGSALTLPLPTSTRPLPTRLFSSSASDEFGAFAATLEEDNSSSQENSAKVDASSTKSNSRSWQEDLDKLLDPATPFAERQAILPELLSANEEIRSSVEEALRERKIDPLLTPRSKRLEAGSRAVARQLTTDLLPLLLQNPSLLPFSSRKSSSQNSSQTMDLSKVSNRIFSALSNQMQSSLKTLQEDLTDPRRIPSRIANQRDSFVQELTNIFAETPAGLEEPPYTVAKTTADYEIRDYEPYTVASTSMVGVDDMENMMDPTRQGAAFNSLAAYIFGANRQQEVLDMTTPVATTMRGEMRFYLSRKHSVIPDPLQKDEARSVYETGQILIQEIPPCRLAVRRFPGFATEGEISRQKKALLAALELDQVEVDAPHGATVPHVVFQYNPPYTIPVIRRNEIGVAVLKQ